jgi:DNA modification methylase
LQYKTARDEKDEQHISPLQLDVIERCVHLWSNPNDIVFTPFMGIGSEVYGAVELGRKGMGIELKPSYYSQAVKNLEGLKSRTNTLL